MSFSSQFCLSLLISMSLALSLSLISHFSLSSLSSQVAVSLLSLFSMTMIAHSVVVCDVRVLCLCAVCCDWVVCVVVVWRVVVHCGVCAARLVWCVVLCFFKNAHRVKNKTPQECRQDGRLIHATGFPVTPHS